MDCPAQATITPYTVIRREKRLPVRGEVLVGLGDRVEPTTLSRAACATPRRIWWMWLASWVCGTTRWPISYANKSESRSGPAR